MELDKKTSLIPQNCQRYDLFLNYTGFEMEWKSEDDNHISQILVTDVELSNFVCDISSFSYCNHNAKLCIGIILN